MGCLFYGFWPGPPKFPHYSSNKTFWWALQTKTEWVIFEPARTHHFGLMTPNFENPIFRFGCFSLKAACNSCKLHRILQVANFWIMYSFTHTNIVFLFRHLPNEIVIFINVLYQIKCFSGDSFFFFSGICNRLNFILIINKVSLSLANI